MKEVVKKILAIIGVVALVVGGLLVYARQYAHIHMVGTAVVTVTQPDGEEITFNLDQSARTMRVKLAEVEKTTVRVNGDPDWLVVGVSSLDQEAHYLFVETDGTGLITHVGITALSIYNWR